MQLISNIKLIWVAVGNFRRAAIFLFFIILATAVSESVGLWILLPFLEIAINAKTYSGSFGYFADFINLFPEEQHLAVVSCLLFILILVKCFFLLLQNYYTIKFITDLRRYWASGVFDKYLHSKFEILAKYRQGTLLNNIIYEPSFATKSIREIVDFVAKATLSLFIFVVLITVNWRVTMLLVFMLLVVAALTWQATSKFSFSIGKKKIKVNQQVNSLATESLLGIRQIKIFSMEHDAKKFFVNKLNALFSLIIKFTVISKLPKIIGEVLMFFVVVSVIIYCSYINKISIASIIPLLGFFLISSQKLFSNLSVLATQRMSILSYLPSLHLVDSVVSDSENIESTGGCQQIESLKYGIRLKGLSFAYEEGKQVFDNLTFEIKKGDITAIVGPSGSGKSTLCDLLAGFFKPCSGRILIDDKDLQEYNLKSWRNHIGYISQDTFLFNRSVRENIICGKPGATEEAMVRAATQAGAHEFILSLPEGYDTVLGDSGIGLSGGQRQRIAIARALIRNADLLILDEATSSLDSEAESGILSLIDNLRKEKTVIIITHRLSSLKNMDQFFVLDKGKLIESGQYHELIEKKGLFSKLAESSRDAG